MLLASASNVPGADIVVAPWEWALFVGFVALLVLADLFLFHREAHEISLKEAAVSTAAWVVIGLGFGLFCWWWLGGSAATQYFTGYVIEKSLSVDNVFVWAVILGYFAVPRANQHRVLFWGIFGALVLRAIFIFTGVALLQRFEVLLLVFGAFLVFTGWRVGTHDETEIHPERNPALKLVRRVMPVTAEFHGTRFTVVQAGKRYATPMFVVLVLIEATDVVFAVDSIPAILAISRSQFIVFSSNAFAILGLRSLYFVLAGAQDKLVHLNKGLGVILAYVGVKMLLSWWGVHIATPISLAFIAVVLGVTVLASLRAAARASHEAVDG
ncbi:TerC family protein [Rhabdothermincola sediminis]|uniref:TerC family protein n=1 Tax=Rhabdothermincola sediminis TaxID=2751370 RepID=UPI001AA03E39|nr:TerC family protein [Rhabdothermincola sediminis]